ncbi:MAG: hypothetical protein ACYTCN_03825, partial [Planctomycetota bacterium]
MKFRGTAIVAFIFVLTIAFSGILQAAPGQSGKAPSREIKQLLDDMRGPNGVAAGHDKVKPARIAYK